MMEGYREAKSRVATGPLYRPGGRGARREGGGKGGREVKGGGA
jgi:hypothetical protein